MYKTLENDVDNFLQNNEFDLIIVGAGGAGLTAALEAKKNNISPLIIEKMDYIGGNTLKASSGINASESQTQISLNIEDTNDNFFRDTLKGGCGTNDKKLLRYFVDNSASAINWLNSMDIKLNNLTNMGGMFTKRTHLPEDGSAVGNYIIQGLIKNINRQDIHILTGTSVFDIIKKNNHISSVRIKLSSGEQRTINTKAVILSTGGFGANKELIKKIRPDLSNYITTNHAGSTGDCISFVKGTGAITNDLNKIQIHPTVHPESHLLIAENIRGEGAILIDSNGLRFINEMDTRNKVSNSIKQIQNQTAYLIFDHRIRKKISAINFYEKKGILVKKNTLNQLAYTIDIPFSNLSNTVEKWNYIVETKIDTSFNRNIGIENGIITPPYYAIKVVPGIHYTMGGIKINVNTEAIDINGITIKGLYIAGEAACGFHGDNRIGGNSLGEIIVFGRQAGYQASIFIKNIKQL